MTIWSSIHSVTLIFDFFLLFIETTIEVQEQVSGVQGQVYGIQEQVYDVQEQLSDVQNK